MRSRFVLTVAVLFTLAGCGVATLDEHPCPPESTPLTYENFGQAFLAANCQRCHGAAGPDRQGAPSAYDFGTQEDARAWRDRIFERAAFENTSMPPGPDDPPESDRMKLGEWLSCGAP
jgi:hypothetical protein